MDGGDLQERRKSDPRENQRREASGAGGSRDEMFSQTVLSSVECYNGDALALTHRICSVRELIACAPYVIEREPFPSASVFGARRIMRRDSP